MLEVYPKEPLEVKCLCPFCGKKVSSRKCYSEEGIPGDDFLMDTHVDESGKTCNGSGDRAGREIWLGDRELKLGVRFVFVKSGDARVG